MKYRLERLRDIISVTGKPAVLMTTEAKDMSPSLKGRINLIVYDKNLRRLNGDDIEIMIPDEDLADYDKKTKKFSLSSNPDENGIDWGIRLGFVKDLAEERLKQDTYNPVPREGFILPIFTADYVIILTKAYK